VKALDDRIAIVTGGGGGIGGTIAQRFSREGAKVAIVDIDGAAAAFCAQQIAAGGNVLSHAADVTHKQAVLEIVSATLDSWGRIDILANVAGGAERKPVIEMSAADWDRVVDANLKSVFSVARPCSPQCSSSAMARLSIFPPSMVSPGIPPGRVMPRLKPVLPRLPNHWRSNTFETALVSTPLRRVESKHPEFAAITPMRLGPPKSPKFLSGVPGLRMKSASTALFLVLDENKYITGQTIHVNGAWLNW